MIARTASMHPDEPFGSASAAYDSWMAAWAMLSREGSNDIQGAFKVLTVHLSHQEKVQLAAEVPGALGMRPDAVFDDAVEQVLAEQGSDVIRDVRQTLYL